MTTRYRDVIGDADVALLRTPDADMLLALGVNNVEDLLGHSGRGYRLEDDEVLGRLVNADDVDDAIVVRDLEGEHLFAELAVELLELDDDRVLVQLEAALGLEPALEALQVNGADGARAVARTDERVELPRLILLLRAPADSTLKLRTALRQGTFNTATVFDSDNWIIIDIDSLSIRNMASSRESHLDVFEMHLRPSLIAQALKSSGPLLAGDLHRCGLLLAIIDVPHSQPHSAELHDVVLLESDSVPVRVPCLLLSRSVVVLDYIPKFLLWVLENTR